MNGILCFILFYLLEIFCGQRIINASPKVANQFAETKHRQDSFIKIRRSCLYLVFVCRFVALMMTHTMIIGLYTRFNSGHSQKYSQIIEDFECAFEKIWMHL